MAYSPKDIKTKSRTQGGDRADRGRRQGGEILLKQATERNVEPGFPEFRFKKFMIKTIFN